MKTLSFASVCAVALMVSAGQAQTSQTLWPPTGTVDTFESYADNAAVDLVYDSVQGKTGYGISTEQNHTASGTKSYKSMATDDNAASDRLTGSFAATAATASGPLTSTVWFYDPAASGSSRSTLCVGSYGGGTFGTGTLNNFVCLGTYSVAPGDATKYNTRIVAPSAEGWKAGLVSRSIGWHEFKIVLTNTVTFLVDNVDTRGASTLGATATWNSFRLGSPAGVSGNTSYYDDISVVKTIPAGVDEWGMY